MAVLSHHCRLGLHRRCDIMSSCLCSCHEHPDNRFWSAFWGEICQRPFTIFFAVMGAVFIVKSIAAFFR